eukprot:scaffold168143_cov48-Attheya_sp.AAC.1
MIPPRTARHPLHLLDSFLESLEQQQDDTVNRSGNHNAKSTCHESLSQMNQHLKARKAAEEKRRLVLKVANFAYGGTKKGSLLEAAVTVLDNHVTSAVRLLRTVPSDRIAYLVRGSSVNNTSNTTPAYATPHHGNSSSRSSMQRYQQPPIPVEYLVFLGDARSFGGLYCSCRSFHERAKHDRTAICKHILAAKLAPHLQFGYTEEK